MTAAAKLRLPLLDDYLSEQQKLTAVERFARSHDVASDARRYRAMLPAAPPGPGQQYAFEVDLDACSGCKSCVTACHSLNGLDEGETWRVVGMLHGGRATQPITHVVTSACHHCLEPACMLGCPVAAYEKHPVTGIVKHLDDQCIGCQYCTFTCPYEVPQYSSKRGIVRKCDMCSGRLAVGEPPACVQACPTHAISITVIDQRQALEDAQGDAFLPGTPSPAITIPTTVYRTAHPPPRNLLPVDFYRVAPAPRHVPLVIMLVFTQLSVGAFIVDAIVSGAAHAFTALVVCAVALLASVFHIGRPLYAFRAVIGLRTSWMSREIVAFGAFAMLAIAYALVGGAALRDAVAAFGVVGIACSVMIYHATRRVWWSATIAGFKFFMTAALLGIATSRIHDAGGARELAYLLVIASAVKGLGEAAVFVHLRDKRYTELRRSAVLMTRDLRGWTAIRFAALALGGIALPLATADGGPVTATASLVLLLVGELCERTLFFAAASAPGMPKGLC